MAARDPILVVGAPRSGTTWVGQVLGRAPGVRSVHEPDNEANVPLAVRAKRTLGRFPVLDARSPAPRAYEQLWAAAFNGSVQARTPRWIAARLLQRRVGRAELRAAFCEPAASSFSAGLRTVAALAPQPRLRPSHLRAVVKSINAALAIDWIAGRFRPQVVVVLRHPFNVIASWVELGWKACSLEQHPLVRERYCEANSIPLIPAGAGPLARVTWQIGLLTTAMEMASATRPDWLVIRHEALCVDPPAQFRRLFDRLGLVWSEQVAAFLDGVNRPGEGTVANRIASEQPERWRTRLDRAQVQEISAVLSGFPLRSWPGEFEPTPGR